MVMDEHLCPWGLKAKDLLSREGFDVDDKWLTSKEATEAFKAQHGVKTTPQVFIGETRVGGYDDLRRYLGKPVADPKATSYQPVIALFSMTALMALAASYAVYGNPFTGRALEWFIAFSMAVLALLKLQNIETFSAMFLNYDLLGAALGALLLHLSVRRGAGGHPDDRARAELHLDSGRAVHRHDRRGLGVQGGLYRQARAQMRLRRRRQQCAARLHLADRKPDDDRDGAVDARHGFVRRRPGH